MRIFKKIPISILLITIFSIGGIVGIVGTLIIFPLIENNENENDSSESIRQSGYSFINPLMECDVQGKSERQKYVPFEDVTINRIKKEIIAAHPHITMGLYVRNLNNGPWFGINENEYYSPASIMKVPILITYLEWMEQDPTVGGKKFILGTEDFSNFNYFPPSKSLTPGKEYTIKELLEEMIIYSDNKAMGTLAKNIPTALYTKVSKDLGITVPGLKTPEDFLSVKDIATFFRILYNASYLNRDSSEYALNILSKVDFNQGLRAGVPKNIAIAHKFGERGYEDQTTGKYIRQLHDCGIVYYERYPYLACIVTKGNDFDENANIIASTSKIIFEEISKAFPEN